MFDRYDRDDGGRSRGDSFERHRGSQAGGDRDDDGRSAVVDMSTCAWPRPRARARPETIL